MSLEVQQLHSGYGRMEVLHGLSLRTRPGVITAVLGPNGAGKTTLLRTLAGVMRSGQGKIILNDRDVTAASPSERARRGVCYLSEGRAIFPSLTVAQNIQMHSARSDVSDPVAVVGSYFPQLGRLLHRQAGTLSGGEQQMLAVSRAALTKPTDLLIDELSFGLAPLVLDVLFEFLASMRSQGVGVLLVEQYVRRALDLADECLVIKKGQVELDCPASEISAEELAGKFLM